MRVLFLTDPTHCRPLPGAQAATAMQPTQLCPLSDEASDIQNRCLAPLVILASAACKPERLRVPVPADRPLAGGRAATTTQSKQLRLPSDEASDAHRLRALTDSEADAFCSSRNNYITSITYTISLQNLPLGCLGQPYHHPRTTKRRTPASNSFSTSRSSRTLASDG